MAPCVAFSLLNADLRRALEDLGYREPTPAQEAAIPIVLLGSHTLIVAPTGSGKTEAAVLPVFSKMLERGLMDCVEALYVTPLRALNRDLLRRLSALAEAVGIKVEVRHSDTAESARRRLYSSPPHLLITTSESLQIVLLNRAMRRALRCVRHVIVDEIHELVGSKRGVQLALGLERLVELAGEFQRIGLSATVGNVQLVAGFLAGSNREVKVVDVSASKRYEIDVVIPTPSESDYAEAERLDVTPETLARLKYLADLLRRERRGVLVFTNTRDGAEFLSAKLKALLGEGAVDVHHSSLSRDHRLSVEERLKSGDLKAVVATSSLELGIDIGHIGLVVQYGSPRQVVRLVQRVGRGGHRLDEVSRGIVVATDLEDYLESEVIAERAVRRELESAVEYHEAALDVLLHQIVGMALEARLDGRELAEEDVLRIARRAHPYSNLTPDDLKLVLDFAHRHKLLEGLKPRRGSIKYYFENVSTIPDEKNYKAVDQTTGRTVGELDREFVFSIEPGAKIILSGRAWTVSKVEGSAVFLYPEADLTGALPGWIGEEIPVPREVAEETCRRRAEALRAALRGEYAGLVDVEGLSEGDIPTPDVVRIHLFGKYAVVHACLGSKGNEALGMYLSRHLSGYLGPVGYRADPYRVLLIHKEPIIQKPILEAFHKDVGYVQKTLMNAVKSSRMFKYRFLQVARRVGLLSKEAEEIPPKLVDAYSDDLPGIEAANEIFVEKLDLKALLDLIEGVQSGRYKLEAKRLPAPTAVDKPLLEEALRVDFTYKGLSQEAVRDLVRKRILNREVTLFCLNCGWTFRGRAALLPERPHCLKCGVGALAVVKGDLGRAVEIWKKFKARRKLDREEAKLFDELRQSASLVLEYGRVGVLVQLAHGVGPKTAVKILNRLAAGDDLWGAIIDAERQYAATRAFWD